MHFIRKGFERMSSDTDLSAFFANYASAWTTGNLESLALLWEDENPDASFIVQELDLPLFDRAGIREHLGRTRHRVSRSEVQLRDVRSQDVGEDLVLVTFLCRWHFDWISFSRVAALLRHRAVGYRFVHYMEAPYHTETWV